VAVYLFKEYIILDTTALYRLSIVDFSITKISDMPNDGYGIAKGKSGEYYVLGYFGRMYRISADGKLTSSKINPAIHGFLDFAMEKDGKFILVNNETDTIYRLDFDSGNATEIFKLSPTPNRGQDVCLTIDAFGNIIIAQDGVGNTVGASEIVRLSPDGSATTVFRGSLIQAVSGITIDAEGNYIVADYSQSVILSISPDGSGVKLVSKNGLLSNIRGISSDAGQNTLIISLGFDGRVMEIVPGRISWNLLAYGFQYPTAAHVFYR